MELPNNYYNRLERLEVFYPPKEPDNSGKQKLKDKLSSDFGYLKKVFMSRLMVWWPMPLILAAFFQKSFFDLNTIIFVFGVLTIKSLIDIIFYELKFNPLKVSDNSLMLGLKFFAILLTSSLLQDRSDAFPTILFFSILAGGLFSIGIIQILKCKVSFFTKRAIASRPLFYFLRSEVIGTKRRLRILGIESAMFGLSTIVISSIIYLSLASFFN